MEPIEATFIPTYRYTRYGAIWDKQAGYVKATWTLHLELVDPAGAPAPAEPGSKAAVDAGCDNAGVGLPSNPYVTDGLTYEAGVYINTFEWHHPDAAQSIPPGKYHCNHLDMGPHGHQALITVVIRDSNWECSVSYKGTNSTSRKPLDPSYLASHSDVEASVKNGTASTPKCSPLR